MENNDIDATPIGAHEPALGETMVLQGLVSQEIKQVNAEDSIAIKSGDATAITSAITSDNSQSTADGQETVFTPPAASEAFSSQSTNPDEGLTAHLEQLAAQRARKRSTSTTPPKPNITLNASQKRTADGHVKPKTSNTPSPKDSPPVQGHARNISTVSNASSVASRLGEFSSELKTRLSYAILKVQMGWESKSITEVEAIASQAESPASSSSTFNTRRNPLTSPRAAIANVQGQGSRDVFGPRPTADFDLYAQTEPPSRTYEAFWRDHSAANGAHSYRHNVYNSSSPQSKSLAPPADIRPTASSRRSDSKFSKPPSMPGHSSANSHHSFNNNSAPRTPNTSAYYPSENVRVSEQKTRREQDAIASLLLMGSPGNSQNRRLAVPSLQGNQISPQNSPLRAEFSLQMAQNGKSKLRSQSQRRVEFAESVSSAGSDDSYQAGSTKSAMKSNRNGRRITDRMLDEMVDESSDEEVELAVPQGRRITGRF